MRKIVKNLQNKIIICISIKKDKKKLLFELKRKKCDIKNFGKW